MNASAHVAAIPPTRSGHIRISSVHPGSAAHDIARPTTRSGTAAVPCAARRAPTMNSIWLLPPMAIAVVPTHPMVRGCAPERRAPRFTSRVASPGSTSTCRMNGMWFHRRAARDNEATSSDKFGSFARTFLHGNIGRLTTLDGPGIDTRSFGPATVFQSQELRVCGGSLISKRAETSQVLGEPGSKVGGKKASRRRRNCHPTSCSNW